MNYGLNLGWGDLWGEGYIGTPTREYARTLVQGSHENKDLAQDSVALV